MFLRSAAKLLSTRLLKTPAISSYLFGKVPLRFFSEEPKKDNIDPMSQKMLDEIKSGNEEKKSMPGLFYGTAAALIFAMFYLQYILQAPKKQEKKPHVKILGEAKIGGPWSALNKEGSVLTDADFRNSYLVFYFGFTRCPDICPASLQKLSSAINLLKERGVKSVRFLFVSLDVGRDTPELVDKYTKIFHNDIEPLVVREQDLTNFLKTFKLYSRKVLNDNDYMLDHTTYMYLFDKGGKFVNVLGANLNYEELANVIHEHIKEIEE